MSTKKNVCVTGATGYIGGHVVEAFLKKGYAVNATVRDPSDSKCVCLSDLETSTRVMGRR